MDIKNLLKTKLAFFCLLLISFFVSSTVDAATLKINSSSTSLSPGGITTLSVVINSEGVPINNAEAKIIYPSDLLEVVSINKGGSVFSLWVEEPAYSNVSGIITFNGGIPTPGFNGSSGTALSFVVKAKKAGQADLIFSDSAVRADDGFGTDVLNSKTGKTLSIVQKEEPVVADVPAPQPSLITLNVTSLTHPSQELWYKDNNPIFKWKLPTGITSVQTGIDSNIAGVPRVTISPATSERSVKNLKDGIWYFKVRAQKDGKWGPTSTYIARIDTTIPKKNDVTFIYDDTKKVLNINADIIDETSGLDYYEIYINDVLVKKVDYADFVDGNYSLPYSIAGNHTVKLVAFDRAGNSVESVGIFTATIAPVEQVQPLQPLAPAKDPYTINMLAVDVPVIYLIIVLVIVLIIGAFKLGRQYDRLHKKIIVRSALVRGDHSKILLLLKKRLEKHLEILQNTRHTRILSKEEKEIKEAIEGDLDEVDKAIEDHKKEQIKSI